MRVFPVLDLQAGLVVRGVAGRRHEYRPIVSQLCPSSQPLDVVTGLRDRFASADLYLADLDAIAGAPPAWATLMLLRRHGFRLWLDAGIRNVDQADALAEAGMEGIIVGLETVPGPAVLAEIVARHGERVAFSLDLRGGNPLGEVGPWRGPDPWSIAVEAVERGVRKILVLDLQRVGVHSGPGTEALCSRLAGQFPAVELWAGGGVRGLGDLQVLQAAGVSVALVASALHDGLLSRVDLDALARPLHSEEVSQ
jgi:phosphoribosylformimino-5-aminoimidazole carboxamide ribotide isomerase